MLPGSLLVGRLADGVSDRDLVQSLSYLSLFSVLLVLNTTWIKYTLSQYVLGSVVLFSLLNTLEGVIMALMSKLISPQLAKGTFNSGTCRCTLIPYCYLKLFISLFVCMFN